MENNFNSYFDSLGEAGGDEEPDLGSFMRAYGLTGEAKLDGCCDFIETLIDNGAKFLVFAHHMKVMDGLEAFLHKKKTGFIRIDGKVSAEKRNDRVKAF